MDRPSVRHGIALLVALAVATLPAIGCRNLLTTAAILINGTDVDAEFKDLKGRKVAVVCRPLVTLQYRDSSVGRDLAQQVAALLQKQVPKIQLIDQRKINRWTDENTWEDYPEVGKAVKAEMVVGIDLESFSIYQGQTLYQGKANAALESLRLPQREQAGVRQTAAANGLPAECSNFHMGARRGPVPPGVHCGHRQPTRPALLWPRSERGCGHGCRLR